MPRASTSRSTARYLPGRWSRLGSTTSSLQSAARRHRTSSKSGAKANVSRRRRSSGSLWRGCDGPRRSTSLQNRPRSTRLSSVQESTRRYARASSARRRAQGDRDRRAVAEGGAVGPRAPRGPTRRHSAHPTATPINEALGEARVFLGWRVEEQLSATSTTQVARALRGRLESVGFLVLQIAMTPAGSRGFSLDDDLAPVIAVNSAYNTEARVFSYMHEYAHVARGSSSICSRVPETTLERRCEDFAAAFLMPRREFEHQVDRLLGAGTMVSSLDEVGRVARRFRVTSRHGAAAREARPRCRGSLRSRRRRSGLQGRQRLRQG